jgi:hypothetical protein
VSDKLIKQVAVELEQLSNLLQTYRPLVSRCATVKPDPIELSALAAMLHAFYTGIENILKRIAMERDGGLPRSEIWHRQLLDAMTHSSLSRPEVISTSLRDSLRMYLDFRHVFRHAYTFELRWKKWRALFSIAKKLYCNFKRSWIYFSKH